MHVSYCFYSEISPESDVWEDLERGYYVETIGQVNEETIKKYIEEQEKCSRIEG